MLWLEDYLSTSFGGTLLCVSHDADFLDTVCTDVIELDSQQLTNFSGPTPGVVYRFLSGRESRVAKRTKDYETQEKTIKKSLNKGQPRKVGSHLLRPGSNVSQLGSSLIIRRISMPTLSPLCADTVRDHPERC